MRRQRDDASHQHDLFGEPGWDILLDLFLAARRGTRVHVSSVCAGSRIPSTTVLRWISRLEREGLAERLADAGDARRRHVRLTPAGDALVVKILAAILPD